MKIIHYLSFGIGIAGIIVIVWGAVLSLLQFAVLETKGLLGGDVCRKKDYMRQHLGTYILMGLEFLIAADLIRSVMNPTLQELAVLGSIVVIRTIISYSVNKEMSLGHKCDEK